MLVCTRSVDDLWKMHLMHSFAAAAAFREKRAEGNKSRIRGVKHHYTQQWRYLTFQFDLNDTWFVQRSAGRASVCPSEEEKQLVGVPDWARAKNPTQRSITSTAALRLGTRLRCHEVKCQVTNK